MRNNIQGMWKERHNRTSEYIRLNFGCREHIRKMEKTGHYPTLVCLKPKRSKTVSDDLHYSVYGYLLTDRLISEHAGESVDIMGGMMLSYLCG